MLFYDLINQIKDIKTLESLSVQAHDEYFDPEQNKLITNDPNYKWSEEIKCDKGLTNLGMNIGYLKHLKELNLNLAG